MKRILLSLSLLITGITLAPAQTNSGVVWVSIDPTGAACSAVGPLVVYFPSGAVFSCQSGHLANVGGSSGGTCSTLAGDVTGTCAANTVVKVHGVAYPTVGSVGQVPVVTGVSTGGTVAYTTVPSANQKIKVIGASFDGGGSALTTSALAYAVSPSGCTITGYNVLVDTGTVSVDVWKIASGTAIPTISNTILTGGFPGVATGTVNIVSGTGLFTTTTVTANDIFGFSIEAVASATRVNIEVVCSAS